MRWLLTTTEATIGILQSPKKLLSKPDESVEDAHLKRNEGNNGSISTQSSNYQKTSSVGRLGIRFPIASTSQHAIERLNSRLIIE